MIRTIHINNFKSIPRLGIELGRVTVLIGSNGSGKSNILEAIAFASATASDKLDNEFLTSRGIRTTSDQRLMVCALDVDLTENKDSRRDQIKISVLGHAEEDIHYTIKPSKNKFRNTWAYDRVASHFLKENNNQLVLQFSEDLEERLQKMASRPSEKREGISNLKDIDYEIFQVLLDEIKRTENESGKHELDETIDLLESSLGSFLIYAPENRELRTFAEEGQILPLGIRGEGLFRLLKNISEEDTESLNVIKEKMQAIDWFDDFEIPKDLASYERGLRIRDRYLSESIKYFDQHSANEGFLFLLFYYCLLTSKDTPSFFAIDNVDSSLNPRLCERLMRDVAQLAKEKNKQVILTTHNAAILDGLDLKDPENRLYSVRRNRDGATIVEQIQPPKVQDGQPAVRLSEAYLRGYLGGLPTNF